MNQSLCSLINNVMHITSSVTSAMLAMSETPAEICSYASMNIEDGPHQCANTMTTDTQTWFQMTFAISFKVLKKCQDMFVSLTRCSLNNYDHV